MEQQRALSALEPYILLSRSATSPRAAADLITQATSAPTTYVFAELLQTSNIQKLRGSEYDGQLKLLEIFAWGTFADYSENANTLPQLTPAQTHKLRLLSLLPLATTPGHLAYAHLQSALSLPSAQALEQLVIRAIYAGLLKSTYLDPAQQTVRVGGVAPLRDVAPGAVAGMAAALGAWQARCGVVLGEIEGSIEQIRVEARARKVREVRRAKVFEDAVRQREIEMAGMPGGGGGRGGRGGRSGPGGRGGKRAAPMMSGGLGDTLGEAMDVDGGLGGGRGGASKGAKRIGRGLR